MCSAPYSICDFLLKLNKILQSSNQDNFALVSECFVLYRQTLELILQMVLQSNCVSFSLQPSLGVTFNFGKVVTFVPSWIHGMVNTAKIFNIFVKYLLNIFS